MSLKTEHIYEGILKKDLVSLAKAMSILESKDHPARLPLVKKIFPTYGRSLRIGISGIPGVGKSTLIEKLGLKFIDSGLSVAVLTTDPASPVSGGSILGDRTRMPELSANKNAFIRCSSGYQGHGGLSRHAKELMLACDAADFDRVIVETIGVGQSEYDLAALVDIFIVLAMPGSGDELQGIKKGIYELADIIAITKADGDLLEVAKTAKLQHDNVISFMPSVGRRKKKVLLLSSRSGLGMDELVTEIDFFLTDAKKQTTFAARRNKQIEEWIKQEIHSQIEFRINQLLRSKGLLTEAYKKTLSKELNPLEAAAEIVNELIKTNL